MNTIQVKITGRNKELFEKFLEGALNVATLIARKGSMPGEYYMTDEHRERYGEWWILQDGRYNILGTVNNHKAFIRAREENTITLEFSSHYDNIHPEGMSYNKTVAEAIVVMLGNENAEIIIK